MGRKCLFFFFLNLFIYLFMAVLGLRFCARAFSSCGNWGPLFIALRGPLTIAASLVAEHRLQMLRLSNLWLTGLVTPWHVGSSQTRARTHVPCISRQILNHWATREAPENVFFLKWISFTRLAWGGDEQMPNWDSGDLRFYPDPGSAPYQLCSSWASVSLV